MSAYRDSLSADQQAVFGKAVQDFAQLFADAQMERDQLASAEGTRAVGAQAWFEGHPLGSIEAIQQYYEDRQVEARRAGNRA